MAEETTAQFLNRREKELVAQISALRGQLGPKEVELAQIRKMKASATLAGGNALSALVYGASPNEGVANQIIPGSYALPVGVVPPKTAADELGIVGVNALTGNAVADLGLAASGFVGRQMTTDAMPPELIARYLRMTIKQLVVQAFIDHFRDGATTTQMRDFIRDAYGRDIDKGTLRTQMHRLKADRVLEQNALTDKWQIDARSRQLYAMYDHPTSRDAMKELQDDPVPKKRFL